MAKPTCNTCLFWQAELDVEERVKKTTEPNAMCDLYGDPKLPDSMCLGYRIDPEIKALEE